MIIILLFDVKEIQYKYRLFWCTRCYVLWMHVIPRPTIKSDISVVIGKPLLGANLSINVLYVYGTIWSMTGWLPTNFVRVVR